jgi:hypothetical protein
MGQVWVKVLSSLVMWISGTDRSARAHGSLPSLDDYAIGLFLGALAAEQPEQVVTMLQARVDQQIEVLVRKLRGCAAVVVTRRTVADLLSTATPSSLTCSTGCAMPMPWKAISRPHWSRALLVSSMMQSSPSYETGYNAIREAAEDNDLATNARRIMAELPVAFSGRRFYRQLAEHPQQMMGWMASRNFG